MEVTVTRVRATNIGGRAPKRPRGYKRPLVLISAGNNQSVWVEVPAGLRMNTSAKSDYTHWLECISKKLAAHAEGVGKELIKTRKKLTAARRDYRELLAKINSQGANTSVDELTQNAQLSRQNREQAEEIRQLEKQLEECRTNFSLIGISKDEKKDNTQARIAKAIREAAEANEKKIKELEKLARELDDRRKEAETTAQSAEDNAKASETRADILENFMGLMVDFNDVSYVDSIKRTMPTADSATASLELSDDAGLELLYTRSGGGLWTLVASSAEDAEEQIINQQLKLDTDGQLTEEGFRHLERLAKAVTSEGKSELQRAIGATRQYKQIYGN